jgi:hypothetical protein
LRNLIQKIYDGVLISLAVYGRVTSDQEGSVAGNSSWRTFQNLACIATHLWNLSRGRFSQEPSRDRRLPNGIVLSPLVAGKVVLRERELNGRDHLHLLSSIYHLESGKKSPWKKKTTTSSKTTLLPARNSANHFDNGALALLEGY